MNLICIFVTYNFIKNTKFMKRIFIFTLIILSVLMSCKQNSSTDNKNIDADSIAISDNIKPDTIIEGSELFFGERVVYSYDNRSNITEETTYDKDNIVQVRVQNYYDSKNNLIKSITNGINIDDLEIEYKYDAKNRKIEERKKDFSFYTRYAYDNNDNLIEELYIKVSSGKVIGRSTYKYQDNKLIESNQDEFSLIYNYNNYKEEILPYDNDEKRGEYHTTYEYDAKGNITNETFYIDNDLWDSINYVYDKNNRIIKKIIRGVEFDGLRIIKYEYNSMNKKIEEYIYSGDDRLESATKFIYKYDEQNRLKSITSYTKDILKYNDDCIVE